MFQSICAQVGCVCGNWIQCESVTLIRTTNSVSLIRFTHTHRWLNSNNNNNKKSFSCERVHKYTEGKTNRFGRGGGFKGGEKAWELMVLMTPHSSAGRIKRGKMSDRLLSRAPPTLHNSLRWKGVGGGLGGALQGSFTTTQRERESKRGL